MLLVTLLGSAFGLWKGYEGDHLETLQPWQWIDAHEVHVGGQAPLPLDVVEMGLPEGITGKVIDIAPCPPFRAGRGRVILTTVNHLHRDVWELALRDRDGAVETVRPTGAHLFYSHSRGQWLAASELQAGERLDGVSGPVAVVSTRRIPGTHRVYNFTVQGEHLYRVAQAGVLVHNNGCATAPANSAGRLRDPATGRFISDPANPPSPYTFTDAQRRAAWKQLAQDHNSGLTAAERAQIEARGWRGPQQLNKYGELETMELSHEPIPLREGGTRVVPRWPADHSAVDPHRHLPNR